MEERDGIAVTGREGFAIKGHNQQTHTILRLESSATISSFMIKIYITASTWLRAGS